MINNVTLMGRMTTDAELKVTTTGTYVTTFTIAVDRGYVKSGEERQTDFISIVAWKKTAEFIEKYFHKGDMIAVVGSIQVRNYKDKNGNNRYITSVIAKEVSFCGSKNATKEPTFTILPDDNSFIDDSDECPF